VIPPPRETNVDELSHDSIIELFQLFVNRSLRYRIRIFAFFPRGESAGGAAKKVESGKRVWYNQKTLTGKRCAVRLSRMGLTMRLRQRENGRHSAEACAAQGRKTEHGAE
jgi:hypothetical protein